MVAGGCRGTDGLLRSTHGRRRLLVEFKPLYIHHPYFQAMKACYKDYTRNELSVKVLGFMALQPRLSNPIPFLSLGAPVLGAPGMVKVHVLPGHHCRFAPRDKKPGRSWTLQLPNP